MRLISKMVLLAGIAMLLAAACTPSVYIIDRPTRLEAEAAGEWPDLEEAMQVRSLSLEPQKLSASKKKIQSKKPYQIIAGEYSLSKPATTTKSEHDDAKQAEGAKQ